MVYPIQHLFHFIFFCFWLTRDVDTSTASNHKILLLQTSYSTLSVTTVRKFPFICNNQTKQNRSVTTLLSCYLKWQRKKQPSQKQYQKQAHWPLLNKHTLLHYSLLSPFSILFLSLLFPSITSSQTISLPVHLSQTRFGSVQLDHGANRVWIHSIQRRNSGNHGAGVGNRKLFHRTSRATADAGRRASPLTGNHRKTASPCH